jgi:hypothetical protein
LFPGGTNASAINNNCLACHSADMVLSQPPLPKAAWEAVVRKMINVYRAPIEEADVPVIVDYLASTKAKASALAGSLRFSPREAALLTGPPALTFM